MAAEIMLKKESLPVTFRFRLVAVGLRVETELLKSFVFPLSAICDALFSLVCKFVEICSSVLRLLLDQPLVDEVVEVGIQTAVVDFG